VGEGLLLTLSHILLWERARVLVRFKHDPTDATVEITLEIEAAIPEGAPDNVVRTVTENCRTLKFRTHGFEED
jgi:hypothetical protein